MFYPFDLQKLFRQLLNSAWLNGDPIWFEKAKSEKA